MKTCEAPGPNPRGLAFDGNKLWHVDINTSKLYELYSIAKVMCEYDVRAFTGGDA